MDDESMEADEYFRTVMDTTLGAVVLDPALAPESESSFPSEQSSDDMEHFIVDDDDSDALMSDLDLSDDEEPAPAKSQQGDGALLVRMRQLFSSKHKRTFNEMSDNGRLGDSESSEESEDLAERLDLEMAQASRDRRMKIARIRRDLVRHVAKRRRVRGFMATPLSAMKIPSIGLKTSLFYHQRVALTYMMLREEIPYKGLRGGFLTDDMGVGKTLQALTLIALDKVLTIDPYVVNKGSLAEDTVLHYPPSLVVTPAAPLGAWVTQLKQHFAPDIVRAVVLHKDYAPKWRELPISTLMDADLVLINYDGLRAMYTEMVEELTMAFGMSDKRTALADWLREKRGLVPAFMKRKTISKSDTRKLLQELGDMRIIGDVLQPDTSTWTLTHFMFLWPWRRAVYDECTKFKNNKTTNFKAVDMVQCERVWSMSGTPLENRMDELYAHLRVLKLTNNLEWLKTRTDWHRFLSTTATGVVVSINERDATNHAIALLKRRIFNVIQLRREISMVNLVNPLIDYVTRAQQDADAWNKYVASRTAIKQQRHTQRLLARRDSSHTEYGTDERGRHLNTTALAMLAPHDAGTVRHHLEHLVSGFYLDTTQTDFVRGYERVDHWLTNTFGYSIAELNSASESMRSRARELRGGETLSIEVIDAIIKENLGDVGGTAFRGLTVPKPILLVAEPSAIEKRVYDHILVRRSEGAETESVDTHRRVHASFGTIASCRGVCADYRFGMDSRIYLHKTRNGDVWNAKEQPHITLPYRTDAPTPTVLSPTGESDEEEAVVVPGKTVGGYQVPLIPPTHYLMVREYLRTVPDDEKVLIMSDHVAHFQQFSAFLTALGYRCVSLTGKSKNKNDVIATFSSRHPGSPQILLGSLRSLYQGMNMQEANHFILYMLDFNAAVEEQAKRRLVRPGQTRTVHIVYLCLRGTIEELVLTRAGEKSEMIGRVIGRADDVAATGANLSRPDPADARLLTFTAEDYEHPPSPLAPHPPGFIAALPRVALDYFKNVTPDSIMNRDGSIMADRVANVLMEYR